MNSDIGLQALIQLGWVIPHCLVYCLGLLISLRASNSNPTARKFYIFAFSIFMFDALFGAISRTWRIFSVSVATHDSMDHLTNQIVIISLISTILALSAWGLLLVALHLTFPKKHP